MGTPTVCIAANGQVDIVRDLHFHHGSLLVGDLLDRDDDLVDVFLVDLLAILEALNHVVNELLGHLAAKLHAIVVGLDRDGVDVESLGR